MQESRSAEQDLLPLSLSPPSKMPKKTAEPKAPAADKKDKKGGGKGKEAEPETTTEGKEPAAKKDKDSKKK